MIIDGEHLRHDPVSMMTDVQEFLGVDPPLDYSARLKWDSNYMSNIKIPTACQYLSPSHQGLVSLKIFKFISDLKHGKDMVAKVVKV